MESALKRSLPSLVQSVSEWFQVELTIKLFGVTIFSFTWPPKSESNEKV